MTAIEQSHAMLDQLERERFYGIVSFHFQDGRIVLIKKEQTIVPTGLNGGKGDDRRP
jgi:hypothetical protein